MSCGIISLLFMGVMCYLFLHLIVLTCLLCRLMLGKKKRRVESGDECWVTAIWGRAEGYSFQIPSALVIGSDGSIYVSDAFCIQRFTPTGHLIAKWGQHGSGEGRFQLISGITLATRNEIHVSILDCIRNVVPELYAFPPGVLPLCVSYIGVDHIYACDQLDKCIQAFEDDGKFIRKWDVPPVIRHDRYKEAIEPTGCTVGRHGVIYVAATDCKIYAFDDNGNFIRRLECQGGEFISSRGISSDGDAIYVSIYYGGCIQCFSPTGILVRTIGQGILRLPHRISILDGILFVAASSVDNSEDRYIFRFRLSDGALIHTQWISHVARIPAGPATLSTCVTKGSNGILYLTDAVNQRVMLLTDPLITS